MKASQLAVTAWVVAGLGATSLAAERVFHGYVEENGLLRESLLLPLGFALICLGIISFVAAIVLAIHRRHRSANSG